MIKPTPAQRNPIRAIRRHCIACSGGSARLVAECPSAECALFPFRSGRNPFRASAPGKRETLTGESLSVSAAGGDDE
jgi:hypothetical protein